MHAAFARWLERAATGDEHAPLLAHHYAEAVLPEDVDLVWGDREDERSHGYSGPQSLQSAVSRLSRASPCFTVRWTSAQAGTNA